MIKSFTLLLVLLISTLLFSQKSIHNKALNNRSDTINILDYNINLDFTDFLNQHLSGNCIITYTPKINTINSINFDLLELNIDSITSQNTILTYSYNDTLLSINLPNTANINDTNTITVYYNGSPQKDASGWGGFYFDGNYAYNLGVGFDASPHNYGRVWFPCFDNFVERSTYQFNIITDNGRNAHCNGYLDSTYTITGDTIMNSWKMEEAIPTYLACVAIADYETVHQTFNGINNSIPVELTARAPDTTNLKNSFINLQSNLTAYENAYGPYMWNKIGFSLVPFNSGAMEHATNIAYPRSAANGTLNNETLMAHEFSHHWWGDLVTCETQEDMWINEGMATYSEHLFLEKIYDYETSLDEIRANNKSVIQFTHLNEGGFKAISGIPHEYTYGDHVYKKGALVAHNMRAYLGDSLFFVGLKSVTTNYQYQHINSSQFRDELTSSTNVDMTNFFNDWVFSPGFSHFNIDSSQIIVNGNTYNINLFIQQKLRGASSYHNGTPLIISFYDSTWNKYTTHITASGQYSTASVNIPFHPVLMILNEENKLNQARTDNQLIINNTINTSLNMSMVANLNVSSISDSALLQIEHHWVAPDSIKNNINNFRISSSRYWSFNGVLPSNFSATARLNYDGRSSSGFLDLDLVPVNGDSLILLYRENSRDDWTEFPFYTKTVFNSVAFGFVILDSLQLGEYTFAVGETTIGLNELNNKQYKFKIYPNPTDDFVWIENLNDIESYQAIIYNMSGKIIEKLSLKKNKKINTSSWNSGVYILNILDKNEIIYNEKIIVN